MESLKSFDKIDGKWSVIYESYDSAYIHQSLEDGLLGKYLLGYKDVKRITQERRYDGFRTITMYLSNGVKLVYTIKA